MVGPLRWLKRAAVAAMMLAALGHEARAQYLFNYQVFQDYTRAGDGSPFADQLCSGTTANIFYDNSTNPLDPTPRISDWCPPVGPTGANFGAQFTGVLFTWNTGLYNFYVGSDDGSGLFIDGVEVLALAGEQPFSSGIAQVELQGGVTHTYLLDYYANDEGGSAIQATVDPRVNVGTDIASVLPTPDVPPDILVASGFGLLGLVERVRRRKRVAS